MVLRPNSGGAELVTFRPEITWQHQRGDHGVVIVTASQHFQFAGFHYLSLNDQFNMISMPYWFGMLITAILPAICLRSALSQRRRNREGLCPTCGYDLRASPERCPECGTVRS